MVSEQILAAPVELINLLCAIQTLKFNFCPTIIIVISNTAVNAPGITSSNSHEASPVTSESDSESSATTGIVSRHDNESVTESDSDDGVALRVEESVTESETEPETDEEWVAVRKFSVFSIHV
jgi:hypothetical protein